MFATMMRMPLEELEAIYAANFLEKPKVRHSSRHEMKRMIVKDLNTLQRMTGIPLKDADGRWFKAKSL